VHMYVNAKMVAVENVRIGRVDKGEWKREWIQLWYI
jgi:hypothetical protein